MRRRDNSLIVVKALIVSKDYDINILIVNKDFNKVSINIKDFNKEDIKGFSNKIFKDILTVTTFS